MRWRGATAALAALGVALGLGAGSVGARTEIGSGAARTGAARAPAAGCPRFGRPAIAADPKPGALRVFAIQFLQQPAAMVTGASYSHAIDCAMRAEVVPYLAHRRPNLVVFDEDVGLEVLAAGPRGATARAMLRNGVPSCAGKGFPCATIATLTALSTAYAAPIHFLASRFPGIGAQNDAAFIAATDQFVRVFMTTMARAALRYRVYIVASNTQAPFRLTRNPAAVAALASAAGLHSVYEPTADAAYDQTFLWGPRVLHRHAPPPLANLLAVNRKLPLTSFEQALGFASGPSTGTAATANLRPASIPGTGVRLGFATSLPAFTWGPVTPHPCADVAITYMRCLNALGANVVIQADANDGQWTGPAAAEPWQPLAWMGSSYRAVSDPTVRFAYAVNPFLVGNLADTPFDGQSAIFERGRVGTGCNYVGDSRFVAEQDNPALRGFAGRKPQFLALAPWVVPDGPRSALRPVGAALAAGSARYRYVQTAVIADLPFPVARHRPGCVIAGR